jgi:hypothetical protein
VSAQILPLVFLSFLLNNVCFSFAVCVSVGSASSKEAPSVSSSKLEPVKLGKSREESSSSSSSSSSRFSRDTRDSRDSRDTRDTRDSRDDRSSAFSSSRFSRDTRDTRDTRDSRDSRDSRYPRDSRDSRDERFSSFSSSRDTRDSRDSRDDRYNSFSSSSRNTRDSRDSQGRTEIRNRYDERDDDDQVEGTVSSGGRYDLGDEDGEYQQNEDEEGEYYEDGEGEAEQKDEDEEEEAPEEEDEQGRKIVSKKKKLTPLQKAVQEGSSVTAAQLAASYVSVSFFLFVCSILRSISFRCFCLVSVSSLAKMKDSIKLDKKSVDDISQALSRSIRDDKISLPVRFSFSFFFCVSVHHLILRVLRFSCSLLLSLIGSLQNS